MIRGATVTPGRRAASFSRSAFLTPATFVMRSSSVRSLLRTIAGLTLVLVMACSRSQPSADSTSSTPPNGADAKAGASDRPARPQLEAVSSFSTWYDSSGACRVRRIVDQEFSQYDGYVLLESTDVTICQTAEGSQSTVSVQRWQDDSVGLAPRYRFEANGERGRQMDAIYEIHQSMSGGGDDVYTYFSMENGGEVFHSNVPAIRLDLNRSPWRRYLALTPGLIQYGDGTLPSARVGIDGMKGNVDEYCVTRFGFVQPGKSGLADSLVVTSNVDPRGPMAVPEFTVRAELSGCYSDEDTSDYWLEIPIVNDRLEISKARMSEGIRLTPATR